MPTTAGLELHCGHRGLRGWHLSALAALTPGLADFQPGFEDADTAVQATVPLYGVYDFVDANNLWLSRVRGTSSAGPEDPSCR